MKCEHCERDATIAKLCARCHAQTPVAWMGACERCGERDWLVTRRGVSLCKACEPARRSALDAVACEPAHGDIMNARATELVALWLEGQRGTESAPVALGLSVLTGGDAMRYMLLALLLVVGCAEDMATCEVDRDGSNCTDWQCTADGNLIAECDGAECAQNCETICDEWIPGYVTTGCGYNPDFKRATCQCEEPPWWVPPQ